MKKFYNEIKFIMPMIIPILIGMVGLFFVADFLMQYKHGGILYVYSWLTISIVSQLIFLKIKKML